MSSNILMIMFVHIFLHNTFYTLHYTPNYNPVMIEKRTWKTDSFQKTKDNESLENQVKRANTQRSETSQQLECERAIRSKLESEVTDLTAQLSSLANTPISLKQFNVYLDSSLMIAETSDVTKKFTVLSNTGPVRF